MKSTIISMIIVLCVLAIIPMFLLDDNSVVARFGLDVFSGSDEHAKLPKNLTSVTTDEKVQVYKWRDQYGVIQFTNTPPPQTQQAELVVLTPDTNIVKAVEVPEEEPEQKRSGPAVMKTGNPYTPGGMKDLLDTTSSLATDMNQKQLEQQQLMEQIMGMQKQE
jgi:hypothetical protein